MLYAGCKAVSQSGSPFDAFYWETYTLLGDPSMTLFWTHADSLSLTATDSIRAGSTHLSLHCNLPCRVSATQDTVLLATELTMADGSVSLSLPAALDGDSITLTATRREAVCDIVTLPIARPAEPCLAAVGHHLEDTVLTVRVRNVGRQAAHSHRIQLTQDSTDREHGILRERHRVAGYDYAVAISGIGDDGLDLGRFRLVVGKRQRSLRQCRRRCACRP